MNVGVALAVGLVLLLLALSPLIVAVCGLVVFIRVQAFRAAAARVPGTVVESHVSVSSSAVPVPTGAGGMTVVSAGGRVASRPVVTYYGPGGEVRTARVRFGALQVYVYGQPVDLLVDPRNPEDVRLAAADGRGKAGRVLLTALPLALLVWVGPAVLFFVFR
jgi:hypothetical protein